MNEMTKNDVFERRDASGLAVRPSVPAAAGTWVQVDRAASEAWALLTLRKPRASALLQYLVAKMGKQNAVVVSQKSLALLLDCHVNTVKNAVRDLVAGRWISVVKLNGPGSVNAYVVNSQVAWGQARSDLRLSVFDAAVVANWEEQDQELLGSSELRGIPALAPGWQQLLSGPGEPPPSEPPIEGLEPDLPALQSYEPSFG